MRASSEVPRRSGAPWTQAEDDRLRALYPEMAVREVARAMGRSENAVKNRANALGFSGPRIIPRPDHSGQGREWAPCETMRLFECWGKDVSDAALATGRPEVAARARALRVPLVGATGKETK